MRLFLLFILLALSATVMAKGNSPDFQSGAVITEYGRIAKSSQTYRFPPETRLKAVFSLSKPAPQGKINVVLDSLARYINMHHAAGIPIAHMDLVLVVKGKALADLQMGNANAKLVRELLKHNVKIEVCNQSAVALGFAPDGFVPGIDMVLSAMTALTLRQNQGYALITL